MPIETDSGYLPDWLAALIGQGRMGANAPAGLFADTAASPSPAVGLLSSLPQFTGVRPDAPAFQGSNAPNGPLPDPAATFTYMNSTPPWGGSGPSNSYPSMAMPQDPGPMNIGPGGAAPSFTGVNPSAPFMANGPTSVQDQYANVPLPPRRPASLTGFQAQSAEDPQDLNAPPPGRPNANVVGTAASGAPEVTAQQPLGFGDYLGKAANAIGSIYGAGGPGDALIALGLSNRTGGASIQALNAMNANRVADIKLQLLKNQLANQAQGASATRAFFQKYNTNADTRPQDKIDPSQVEAAIAAGLQGNNGPLNDLFKQVGPDKYTLGSGPNGPFLYNRYDPSDVKPVGTDNSPINVPVTDPKQRAALGISPDVNTPATMNRLTGQWSFVGGDQGDKPAQEYMQALTKGLTASHASLAGGVEAAQARSRDLSAMQGALARIKANGGTTGFGAEEKLKLQGIINAGASALGMTEPFDVSDPQLLTKFNRSLSGGEAKDVAGARVTNFELSNFLAANPGLGISTTANDRLLGIKQQIEDRNIAVGSQIRQMTADAVDQGRQLKPSEVEKIVRGYDEKHHIFDPLTKQDLTRDPKIDDLQGTGGSTANAPSAGTQPVNQGARKIPMWSYGQ